MSSSMADGKQVLNNQVQLHSEQPALEQGEADLVDSCDGTHFPLDVAEWLMDMLQDQLVDMMSPSDQDHRTAGRH